MTILTEDTRNDVATRILRIREAFAVEGTPEDLLVRFEEFEEII